MDNHSASGRASSMADHGDLAAALAVTRLGVVARLADPYLTEHDRWVLGQFARFLAGMTPAPDQPVARPRARVPQALASAGRLDQSVIRPHGAPDHDARR
jgi:hypothetical protein